MTDTSGTQSSDQPIRLGVGLRFLLVSSFFITFGSFMVLPFMSIFLHEQLGMGLGGVGVLLGVASLIQFSGGMVGGVAADRFGLKRMMVLALVVRSVGFMLFLLALKWPPAAILALLLTACGAALYLPANKAYIVRGVDERRKALFLSLSNSAFNTGMAAGPLLSGLFILKAPMLVFSVTSVIFVAVTVLHATTLITDRTKGDYAPSNGGRERADAHRQPAKIRALLSAPMPIQALTIYIYMFFQNYLGVFVIGHHSATVYSLMLLVNAALVIVVQPLVASLVRVASYRTAIAVAFPAFGLGMLSIFRAGLPWLLLGVILISVGEIVLFLKNELEALRQLPNQPAIAFGYQRLATGVGAFVSGIVGGQIYARADTAGNDEIFWVYVAVQCVIGAALALALVGRSSFIRKARASTSQSATPTSSRVSP
jgi:MFS family permease